VKFREIAKSFVPGFYGSLFAGIFLLVILGEKPINLPWLHLLSWFLLLFIFGLFSAWVILRKIE